jgi:signal transduction protein with GAF and PtsI domain
MPESNGQLASFVIQAQMKPSMESDKTDFGVPVEGAEPIRARSLELVRSINEATRSEACSLWLYDGKGHIVLYAGAGLSANVMRPVYDVGGPGITASIFNRGQAFKADSFEELQKHPEWRGKFDFPIYKEIAKRPLSFIGLPSSQTLKAWSVHSGC